MLMYLFMPLHGISIWVLLHADIFAAANLLSSTRTGSRDNFIIESKYSNSFPSPQNLHINVSEKDLNNSVNFANVIINNMRRLEMNLGRSDISVKTGTPSHGLFISFEPEQEAIRRGLDALIASRASAQLWNVFCNRHDINQQDCAKYLTNYKFTSTPLRNACMYLEKQCSYEKYLSAYRSIDGFCNHKINGTRGQSFTGFTRLLFPIYLDGINEPRRAVDRSPLPSPRVISASIVGHDNNTDDHLTLAVMQWGQFLEHDLSRAATSIMVHTDNPIECCSLTGENLSPRYIHPFCSPVAVPLNDPHFSKKHLNCMNYVRSIPALRSDCSFGPTDQINQATHFLDGSQIYGSTVRKSNSLRSFVNGKLNVSNVNGKYFLPASPNSTKECPISSRQLTCYKSGDSRVNFQPQLTVMHTLWFREHNRIADILAELNGHWDDEILFQETRRIVIAEIQHITYNEWVNKILSKKYNRISETRTEYDDKIDPSVSNSFATAAMRSLKSLCDGNIKLFDKKRSSNSSLILKNYFNNPNIIQESNVFDGFLRGLTTQSSQKLDRHYAEDLLNNLYTNGHYGFDVLSIDIQRGRDHGLPGYNEYRKLCGLHDAEDFDDFSDAMSENYIDMLSKVYTDPNDVDLIVGGILEDPDDGSMLGPTFSCIIADQLMRTKKGDRYFYTNENQPKPFSVPQLNEIKKVTLARILCDNGNDITSMQRNVFEKISDSNPLVPCREHTIPTLHLSLWEESRERYFN